MCSAPFLVLSCVGNQISTMKTVKRYNTMFDEVGSREAKFPSDGKCRS